MRRSMRARADPGDDSDPCGSDTCPSTTRTPRPQPSQTSALASSGSTSSALSNTPAAQPSDSASHTGGQGKGGGGGGGGGNNGSNTATQGKTGFNKSAIGGIVIGILALALIFGGLIFWWRRRRQQQRNTVDQDLNSTADMRLLPGNAVTSLAGSPPANVIGDDAHSRQGLSSHSTPTTMANVPISPAQHNRSASDATLPNPHDAAIFASPPTLDRALPPTPLHDYAAFSTPSYPSTTNSNPHDTGSGFMGMGRSSITSGAPSAWRASEFSTNMYADLPSTRVSSMVSATSSSGGPIEERALLGEMALYQKRLEAHHRKESEDAVAAAVMSDVGSDPPPSYSPTEEHASESQQALVAVTDSSSSPAVGQRHSV
ncbi:hypothetical protein EIP91_006641 [Steccherinum ochraceum]|uniref:Uncharacterized protein n=1 Tax=Steccherinum ochraceum TaxID=92696 RepID=A0A4R0RB57_9APHY|nr:hypothetical protein EIP91_006641 [Steccherinum ochraceum]